MSKTLEELGYKIIFHNEDLLMYRKNGKKMITFSILTKDVAFADTDDDPIITMEELKAIYQYCIDNKWIDDERYKKGYQDGFKQAKFDCEMDKLPYERTIEIKDEYFKLIDFLLIDYGGCKSVETLKELIDEVREYIHKALKNDDKSVITVNSKKKFNILGEEVE